MSTTQNTGTNRAVNLLSSMVVVSLGETRLWTGRAKLKAEDLEVDEEALPQKFEIDYVRVYRAAASTVAK